MSAVKEYGRVLTHRYGAPAGYLETYIEVPFMLGEKCVYPDGLIRVSRGSKTWTALVEVKTGNSSLVSEQLENYVDVAREQGFDAFITISNEIPAIAGTHPTAADRRKLKRVALHHLSWTHVRLGGPRRPCLRPASTCPCVAAGPYGATAPGPPLPASRCPNRKLANSGKHCSSASGDIWGIWLQDNTPGNNLGSVCQN